MKVHINVTVDYEVIAKARAKNINLSSLINLFLVQYFELGIETETDIIKLEKSVNELRAKITQKEDKLNKLKKDQENIAKTITHFTPEGLDRALKQVV